MTTAIKSKSRQVAAASSEQAAATPSPGDTSQTAAQLAVEPFIDKHEVALRLGRTTRTVDNLMRRGFVPYYKVGFRVQFRWSEIQSHLAQTCRICRRSE